MPVAVAMMPREELITVDTRGALVMEFGKRDVPAWWMRTRSGVVGLEAWLDGRMLRVELHEPPDGADSGYDAE